MANCAKDEEVFVKYDKSREMSAALMFKALSHPIRVWIVRQLERDEHCVSEFVKALDVEFATVSRHLAKLKQARLVISHKEGREIWYAINRSSIAELLTAIG